jgi:hypothetical protein
VKVVRRWLGTVSRTATETTSSEIVAAAISLLNPATQHDQGDDRTRSLLVAIEVSNEADVAGAATTECADSSMDVEGEESPKEKKKNRILSFNIFQPGGRILVAKFASSYFVEGRKLS